MLSSYRTPLRTSRWFPALVLFLAASAGAQQELLKNGDFEAPFPGSDPTTNWTLVYTRDGGPADFSIAGQTTEASSVYGGRGAHLRAIAPRWTVHAYFKQVVTNLTAEASYTLHIRKMKKGWDNADLQVWAALVSGTVSNVVFGNSTIVGPYSLVITADASRQIEVQLHMKKNSMNPDTAEDYRSVRCTGWFDDFSLKLTL